MRPPPPPQVRELVQLFAQNDSAVAAVAPLQRAAGLQPPLLGSVASAFGSLGLVGLGGGGGGAFGAAPLGGAGGAGGALEEDAGDAHFAMQAEQVLDMVFRVDSPPPALAPSRAGNSLLRRQSDEHACVICFANPVAVRLEPCGHASFCVACVGGLRDCPLCRAPVRNMSRLAGASYDS